jgi:hypothetical protein
MEKITSDFPVKVADSKNLYSLDYFVPQGTVARRKEWIRNHQLYAGMTTMGERIMTPVYIGTDPGKKTFLMDVVTGSLYDMGTKRCLSSGRLMLGKVTKKDGLGDQLMKIKGDLWK